MKDESILKQQQRSNTADIISSLTITVMMILIGLLITSAAAKVYKNIVVTSADNFELRTSLFYVAQKIRSADNVTVISADGYGNILKLDEEFDGELFSTYVFHRAGYLCEIMQDASFDFDEEGAVEVMEIEDFSVEASDSGFLLRAVNSVGKAESLYMFRRNTPGGTEKL